MRTKTENSILREYLTKAELAAQLQRSIRSVDGWALSPGFFSHLVMAPSKIHSPIWGMTTSVGIVPFP